MKPLIHINEWLIKKKLDKANVTNKEVITNNNDLRITVKKLLDDGITNFNCLDVSKVKDFKNIFNDKKFEEVDFNISEWDISNGVDFSFMFANCHKFIGYGVENWNVSKAESMTLMFENCYEFNADLSAWDVSNVEAMRSMFSNCKSFEGKGLDKWDVSNVKYISRMFYNCENLDVKLDKWNTNKVQNMFKIFYNTKLERLEKLPQWYIDK